MTKQSIIKSMLKKDFYWSFSWFEFSVVVLFDQLHATMARKPNKPNYSTHNWREKWIYAFSKAISFSKYFFML